MEITPKPYLSSLSLRQFVFSICACGVAVGLYFLLRPIVGMETVNAYNGIYFKLTADIDLSGYQTGVGWVPIGYDDYYTFKGNGKTITGLYINSTANYAGLFGNIENGTVENLGLVGVNINGNIAVGGVVGYVNSSTVQNCAALNPSVTGSSSVGRVVGFVVISGGGGTRSGNYAWSAMPGT